MEDETPSLPSDKTLRVTLLSSEWKSLKGGLSTINSELAIQLAKHLNVEVYVYLPKCTEEDKKDACSHNVQLIEAEELPGFEPINWLTCLPKGHLPHCLIGHGLNLGRQIPAIKLHHDCKWVQVVHTAPEELGMYKTYEEAIFKGEQKHHAELLKLCELADQVVAVGPKLADAYSRYLRFSSKDQDVINLTPSIFTEFLNVQQATEERRTFCVLIFGRDDGEDFKLKGYDIAAQAVSELKDSSYQLMFFGAPVGKEDEVTEKLLQHGILTSQLTVRPLKGSREDLAKLFCEVDLVIMPSRTEGFGLTALEALSAGLPVLVSGNSGLGDALKKVPSGFSHVVDSEDPKDWAKTISIVRQKGREIRLKEANLLREQYALKYNWKKQCDCLVENMLHLSFGNIQKKLEGEKNQVENANEMDNLEKLKETSLEAALKLKIDVDVMKPTEHSTQDRTPVSTVESGASRNVGQHGTSEVPVSSGQNQPSCVHVNAEAPKAPVYIPTKEEVLRLVAFKFMHTAPPECRDEFDHFLTYLEKVGALLQDVSTGSLLITVKCDSLQILEILWEDYLSGHLGEVIQRSFVTEEILTEFNLAELKLKTIISEEEYKACKAYFEKDLYEGNIQEKLERQQNQVENTNENMDNLEKLKETSQEAGNIQEKPERQQNQVENANENMDNLEKLKETSQEADSKLSDVLKRYPDFLDRLALCLDRNMRLIPNWKHLARELNVDEDVIKKLEQYTDQSPTIRLFEYLEVTQPQLTIQQLRNAMLDIRRNDLFSLLTTKGRFAGSERVQEVMTSELHSPSASLLDEIALALDATSLVLANWYQLAIQLGVPREDCWNFGRRSTQSPTNELFQYLEATCPQMTLKKLKEALNQLKRMDLLYYLDKQSLEDGAYLKDAMTPGSELLQTMAHKLDREITGIKDWHHLAYKLEVPADVRQAFGGVGPKGKSPTKEVVQWLVARFPDTTLKDVVKALDKIQRNDAIQIITRQFPDTVDSSLERLDSSLHSNVSIDLPVNDPTGETLSTRYKREEWGSFKEDLRRAGHCGNLPDPTYLVGRDVTCEQIITCLTSNKAAEIVAPPGYGKTSVVIEVAHRMIKGSKFVAYVKARGVTCVEDLGSQIIEAVGARAFADEDPIKGTMRRLRAFEPKSVVLIIENIDNLLHIEDQIRNEEHDQESGICCAKMRGKYKKDDFLAFLTDIGQCPAIHLVLTSRETVDFSVRFASELIELEPLSDKDSATLFTERDKSLDDELVRVLVRVCGGIPLVICTVLAILKRENPQNLARRLSTSAPRLLVKELNRDFIANEDRIDKCLEVCFNRLSEENQDVLVKISTFPHGFTEEHFIDVFKPPPGFDLQTCMNRLKHSSLVRFDRNSCHYSLHPFVRDYFSLMPQHTAAKSVFIRHYSDLTTKLWKQFLTRDSKSAIEHYRNEKKNIREAMTWCGDDHPELDQTTREYCIRCFNKSAIFLAKMMRKQEFESLFWKLSYRCRYDMHLYSACLTNMGMKIVLSCTCTPHICPIALHPAKSLLSYANSIQRRLTVVDDATRAQCLSKLGFCLVREGHFRTGFDLLNQALILRIKRTEDSKKDRDKVMLAAAHNDLAASQMMQRKHMAAIETRRLFVLPDYESILGDHPFVATTLCRIANSYHALGDYDNAIKFTQRALEIRERLLGDHRETARSFYDLGVALAVKEEYERAFQSLEKAVRLQEEVLDTDDELIHTHQAMSIVLKGLGREKEAEWEMELAGQCAKRLDSVEVHSEIFQTSEEMGWVESDSVPISSSPGHVKSTT